MNEPIIWRDPMGQAGFPKAAVPGDEYIGYLGVRLRLTDNLEWIPADTPTSGDDDA